MDAANTILIAALRTELPTASSDNILTLIILCRTSSKVSMLKKMQSTGYKMDKGLRIHSLGAAISKANDDHIPTIDAALKRAFETTK